MSTLKSFLLAIALLLVAGLVFIYGMVFVEDMLDINLDMHEEYATYAEAAADGAVERGWLRKFVPTSAVNIRDSHNLDSNAQWMSFEFDPSDRAKMEEKLTPAKRADISLPRSAWLPFLNKVDAWWPKDLRDSSRDPSAKYDFYRFEYTIQHGSGLIKYIGYLAIEKNFPRAWYWDFHRPAN